MKKMSIVTHTLMIALFAFLLSGGIMSYILDKNIRNMVDSRTSEIASVRIASILGILSRKHERLQLTQNEAAYEKAFQDMAVRELQEYLYNTDKTGKHFYIVGQDGRLIMHAALARGEKPPVEEKVLQQILEHGSGEIKEHKCADGRCWAYYRGFEPWKWKIVYCLPISEKYSSLNKIRSVFLTTGIASLLFAVILITLSVYYAIKPVKKLAEATAAMADGDLDIDLPKGGFGEAALLSENFNAMRDSIKKTITELKESNEDLESFAYASSHDLKEPLRNITNYAQLLWKRSEKKLDEESRNFMNEIIYSIERMDSLIKGILAYSKAGKTENIEGETDIASILTQIKNDASIVRGAELEFDGSEMPVIRADKAAITSVFQNLIINGIKFNRSSAPKIKISASLHGSEWVFEVMDNGIGIDPDYSDKIFEVFQRLHTAHDYTGSGIGLSVCRKIINRHGGRIWVEQRKDDMTGSIFKFTIPA